MKVRVSRTLLLQALEAIEPGVTPRPTVEQSNCVVFNKGYAISYDERIRCRMKSPLPEDWTAAVRGKPLLELIRRIPDEEVLVILGTGEMKIVGKRHRGGVRAEAKVLLPYNAVEKPTVWKALDENVIMALSMCCDCASKDESNFSITCVRLTPKFVEACDNYQMIRYHTKLPIRSPFLILQDAAKHAAAIGAVQICETDNWVHFRSSEKMVLSCRRFEEDYPDLGVELGQFQGHAVEFFPKGVKDATDLAGQFSGENPDDNHVTVILRDGRMNIRGDGVSAWAESNSKLKEWTGPTIVFGINPKLLVAIVERRKQCEVNNERIKAQGTNWTYLSCIRSLASKNGQVTKEKNDAADD